MGVVEQRWEGEGRQEAEGRGYTEAVGGEGEGCGLTEVGVVEEEEGYNLDCEVLVAWEEAEEAGSCNSW